MAMQTYAARTRLFSTRTFRSSSPGSSTGVSAINAQWANRGSFSSRRNGSIPDIPLADMLVPVQLRSSRRLGIVAVPHPHRIEAHRRAGLLHRLLIALGRHDVVAGNMRVARVQAHAHRRMRPSRATSSATCSKLPPSEHSAPAVFSIRM